EKKLKPTTAVPNSGKIAVDCRSSDSYGSTTSKLLSAALNKSNTPKAISTVSALSGVQPHAPLQVGKGRIYLGLPYSNGGNGASILIEMRPCDDAYEVWQYMRKKSSDKYPLWEAIHISSPQAFSQLKESRFSDPMVISITQQRRMIIFFESRGETLF